MAAPVYKKLIVAKQGQTITFDVDVWINSGRHWVSARTGAAVTMPELAAVDPTDRAACEQAMTALIAREDRERVEQSESDDKAGRDGGGRGRKTEAE